MGANRMFARYEPEARRAPLEDLAIRAAGEADLDAIAALSVARQGGDAADLIERLRERLKSDDVHLSVALHAGRTIGFGRIEYFRHPADDPAGSAPVDPAPSDFAPEGWHLGGVIVEPDYRRRGVASALTAWRLAWIAERSDRAYYCANVRNRASIELHARFGFEELTREFRIPGVTFTGGVGLLFRALL